MSLHTKACIMVIVTIALACALVLALGLWLIALLPADLPGVQNLSSNLTAIWWVIITTAFGRGVLLAVDTAQLAAARNPRTLTPKED